MKVSTMWRTVICWLYLVFAVTKAAQVLNDYIRHYEELTYDTGNIHQRHLRARRSTSDPYVHIEFDAHGRNFNLRLRRDTLTFHPDFKLVDENDNEQDFDRSIIYEGTLWGEPDTRVHGSIIDGVFSGKIATPDETYHVERAFYHFKGNKSFHSIIYADKDIDVDPFRHKREAEHQESAQCGSSVPSIQKFLRENSRVVEDPEPIVKREAENVEKVERKVGENIYTEKLNREKRATVPTEKTCSLYLQTDPEFWDYFKGELGAVSDERVREEIVALLADHVREVKSIYEGTRFKHNDAGTVLDYSGITFTVYRMRINSSDICKGADAGEIPFCKKNIDVTNFLNYNAYQKHESYCLAYVFTYRDFSGGTLGLAWVGNSGTSSGGICETHKTFAEGSTRTEKSLNTGIVSILNYGKRVVPKVSYLTLAHEIGHNFGSNHDEKSQCIPFTTNKDPAGNYIMFASATSGDRPNNREFSPCSLTNMSSVIHSVMQGLNGKRNCFVSSTEAFCGNGIVEKGEECDCGYHGDCSDTCCVARDTPNTALADMCKRTNKAQCSPSEGPCCDTGCNFIAAAANSVCRKAAGCADEAKCAGGKSECPASNPKANGTECNSNTQTCLSGECKGSICSKIPGWEECFLTSAEMKGNKDFSVGDLCFVSCKPMGNGSTCWSSQKVKDSSFPAAFKKMLTDIAEGEPIPLTAGAACDDFQGYCDVFSKCRGVDADGPLARLKNLLFSPDTLEEIKSWVTEYWWAVALMILAFILLMAGFIKVCAVHTPSSNPNKKPARKVSIPHRRPHTQGGAQARGQGPPPDYYPQAGRGAPPPGGPPAGRGQGRGGHRPNPMEMKQRRV